MSTTPACLIALPPVARVPGDDWDGAMYFAFQIEDLDGNALDLTGYSVGGELFVSFGAVPVAVSGVITNAATGLIALSVPASVTAGIKPGPAGTALHVYIVTPTGIRNTVAIQPIVVLDPRQGATS